MKRVLTALMLLLVGVSGVTLNSYATATIEEGGIVLYTKEGCSLCIQAKALLDSKGLKYQSISLENDRKKVTELVKKTSQRMFPFIFVDKKFIGCYGELQELIDSGKLK